MVFGIILVSALALIAGLAAAVFQTESARSENVQEELKEKRFLIACRAKTAACAATPAVPTRRLPLLAEMLRSAPALLAELLQRRPLPWCWAGRIRCVHA